MGIARTEARATEQLSSVSAPARSLAEVLAPLSAADFLSGFFGKNFYRSSGRPGRFAKLLPWTELNQLLRHHRFDVPRLRLVREGKAIPADTYISYQTAQRRPYSRTARLRPVEIVRQLRGGATLIIDSVDEIHEPITGLAEDLESALCSRIQVNMYAGWRSSRGFDLHWDDHDVLILQVSGRKRWKVYPMTREHPLPADADRNLSPPDTPLWEGLLEDGDALYIPRGWWHVAVPLDEPTLHLTVGLHNRTGFDFLSWYQERLCEHAAVRQDLPRFATAKEKAAYMRQLQDAWTNGWSAGLLEEYLAHVDARAQPRPNFALPWAATKAVLPPGNVRLKWIVPRPVVLKGDSGGAIELLCHGKQWRFAASARPLLEILQEKGTCTISELHSDSLDPQVVRSFIGELLAAGLLTAIPHEPGC